MSNQFEEDTKLTEERVFNDTFNGNGPTWANACVGENGPQNIQIYVEGFKEAPLILMDKVIEQGGLTSLVDSLIFPIAFTIRHAVELQIKDSIKKLDKIRENHNIRSYKLTAQHDILDIWNFFKTHANKTDRRYIELIDKICPYITDIGQLDPTGQTFRYPKSNEDDLHLSKTPIINIIVLRKRFSELEALLGKLDYLNTSLMDEYAQGTFTAALSRHDIHEIAKKVPNRDKWGESDEFISSKIELRRDFGLSNTQFSKALKIIEKHHEFAPFIGLECPLFHAEEKHFMSFFSIYVKLNPEVTEKPSEPKLVSISKYDYEYMQERSEARSNAVEECLAEIPLDAFADIASIYELGRNNYWPENYQYLSEGEVKNFRNKQEQGKTTLFEEVCHHIDKTNALKSIITGLRKLGQNSTLNALAEEFSFLREHEMYNYGN